MQEKIDTNNIYINKYLEYLKVNKKYSYNTIFSYKNDILEFYKIISNSNININNIDIKKYLTWLHNNNYNRNTISRKLSSIRSYYNYLFNNDYIEYNLFNDIHNPKKVIKLPNYLNEEDIDKILSLHYEDILGQRNKLIVILLYITGIRVSELVNIKLEDIDSYNNSIKITGKGNKERIVYYSNNCHKYLDNYINNIRSKLDTTNNKYLILNKNGKKITTRMIRNILDNLIIQAKVDKHIYPHMLRHTFATELLNNGADLITVKELLGHENIDTTSIYTHVTDEHIRKVYENCHPRAKEK